MSLKNQVVGLRLNSGDTNTSKGLKVDENSKYIITLVDSQLDVNWPIFFHELPVHVLFHFSVRLSFSYWLGIFYLFWLFFVYMCYKYVLILYQLS